MRLLGDRSLAGFWVARLAEQAGLWIFVVAVLVAAWVRVGDVTLVCWVAVGLFSPRLVVGGLLEAWLRRLPLRHGALPVALQALVALFAALVVFGVNLPFDQVLIASAVTMGFLAAISSETRGHALASSVGRSRLGGAVLADAVVARAGLALGALLGGALTALSPAAAFIGAAVALGAAAAVSFAAMRGSSDVRRLDLDPGAGDPAEQRAIARRSAIYLAAAFTTGALGAALIVAAVPLAAAGASGSGSALTLGVLLAAAGLGMLIGPLPVPRMLLRVSAPLLLFATVVVTGAAAFVVAVTQSVLVAIGALVVFGLAAVTQDALRAIATRRLVPPDSFDRVTRLSALALTAGQIYGALGVISVGSPNPFGILALLAFAQVIIVGAGLLLGGRSSLRVGGLSTLPIKSVVHKLSWATSPVAQPADFTTSDPRVRRLARRVGEQAAVERLQVTLPVSGREYEIYRPDEASRERLFEAGRADPEKQMPYWAKVWPSGVALADVVVQRKQEVTDRHVLELGAGLGVTACAVLEYGGDLITADYGVLPLAHCRLNALVNTGRAPRATCFNWRHESEVMAATRDRAFQGGFPLIIAGDVLYEGRDAEPLLNVIERMLTADGSLWLAEPVRRTAQRFLDSAAMLGWEIDSRQVKADWPDATDGPVNLHFLKRSADADRIIGDLGGWRI